MPSFNKTKPHLLVGLFTLAGATRIELATFLGSFPGRSKQIADILSTLLALDLLLSLHGLSLGTRYILIDKHPGAFTSGISASALVVTKKSLF
jgi:hypothetical protein